MKNKKGVSGSQTSTVASVVLIIGLLIVAYLILLPKDTREDVLEGKEIDFDDFNNGDDDDDDEDRDDSKDRVLLLRNPGTLLPSDKDDVEKKFSSVNLFDTSERGSKKLANSVVVSRTIFSNNFEDLDFTFDNADNIERLSLFFNIKSARGSVEISLNGRTIFEGSLSSSDVPIEIPVTNLRERNTLRLMGSDVGVALLSKNQFELRDLELIQEFNLENKAESRSFEISRQEAIDDARLEFFVNCLELSGDQGILKVFLNRRMVFLGRVVCDASQNKFDLDKEFFLDGRNVLTFEIDKGNYIIEEIEINYELDEGFNPLYFFTIDEDDFDDILGGDDVTLVMKFDNDDKRKRADIRINVDTIFLDVNTGKFEKDITDIVKEGENFIKIFARQEFELPQLEIVLERD